jgi:hypothetical protein
MWTRCQGRALAAVLWHAPEEGGGCRSHSAADVQGPRRCGTARKLAALFVAGDGITGVTIT